MPLLCVEPSVQKCHRHVEIVDISDEHTGQSTCKHCYYERNFANSSEVCSGIVILGLVLSLVFAQES